MVRRWQVKPHHQDQVTAALTASGPLGADAWAERARHELRAGERSGQTAPRALDLLAYAPMFTSFMESMRHSL
jgi:hypothetical protein